MSESKKNPDEMILDTSPDAAHYVTGISGWVDRHGMFFGEAGESTARYSGSTHRDCFGCGVPVLKMYVRCPACRNKEDLARHAARPVVVWDKETPLYSLRDDRFLWDGDDIDDCLNESPGVDPQIVACAPVYLSQIDTEHWIDDLPEDHEAGLSNEVYRCIDRLNKALIANGPSSWVPGKYAVSFDVEPPQPKEGE